MLDSISATLQLGLGLPNGAEWIILLVIGLLLFGRRLPEVGRSIGKSIVEFKKGIKGIEEEIEQESTKPAPRLTEQAPNSSVTAGSVATGSASSERTSG